MIFKYFNKHINGKSLGGDYYTFSYKDKLVCLNISDGYISCTKGLKFSLLFYLFNKYIARKSFLNYIGLVNDNGNLISMKNIIKQATNLRIEQLLVYDLFCFDIGKHTIGFDDDVSFKGYFVNNKRMCSVLSTFTKIWLRVLFFRLLCFKFIKLEKPTDYISWNFKRFWNLIENEPYMIDDKFCFRYGGRNIEYWVESGVLLIDKMQPMDAHSYLYLNGFKRSCKLAFLKHSEMLNENNRLYSISDFKRNVRYLYSANDFFVFSHHNAIIKIHYSYKTLYIGNTHALNTISFFRYNIYVSILCRLLKKKFSDSHFYKYVNGRDKNKGV